VHCSLSPEAVMLTAAGAWKLASLGHCVQVGMHDDRLGHPTPPYPQCRAADLRLDVAGHDWGAITNRVTHRVGLHPQQVQYTVDEAVGRTFDYVEGAAAARLLASPLGYVAPELIASNGASAPPPLSPASDMFSLGIR
jgi:serine/threonine protein kinase